MYLLLSIGDHIESLLKVDSCVKFRVHSVSAPIRQRLGSITRFFTGSTAARKLILTRNSIYDILTYSF